MNILEIKDLHVRTKEGGQPILKGVNLTVRAGEIHAIMGPNGSGKSTLVKAVAGHPAFEITDGSVRYNINGKLQDLLALDAAKRAQEGIFLGFQYPVEIPGVSNLNFLLESFNNICLSQGAKSVEEGEFRQMLADKLALLEMDDTFLARSVNSGFSGGEKKKNEILQMAVLKPRLALLDETDSGLDIDALKTVAFGLDKLKSERGAFVLVTHYQRILEHVRPDHIHILSAGKIVKSGGAQLAVQLEQEGYGDLATP